MNLIKMAAHTEDVWMGFGYRREDFPSTINYDCDRCLSTHVVLDSVAEIKTHYDLGRIEICEECLKEMGWNIK